MCLPVQLRDVEIDGEHYWDGGVVSNTPLSRVLSGEPCDTLTFQIDLWSARGRVPHDMMEVSSRQKDIQYSSRIASHIVRQRETHKLRHVVSELLKYLPEETRADPRVKELAGYSCRTRMHVVRLLAPRLTNETHIKDIDFSPAGIRERGLRGSRGPAGEQPVAQPARVESGLVLGPHGLAATTTPASARCGRSGSFVGRCSPSVPDCTVPACSMTRTMRSTVSVPN